MKKKTKISDQHQIIIDMVETLYPNVSISEKEAIAQTYAKLDAGTINEIKAKMESL